MNTKKDEGGSNDIEGDDLDKNNEIRMIIIAMMMESIQMRVVQY
jgi:hypothetical protein